MILKHDSMILAYEDFVQYDAFGRVEKIRISGFWNALVQSSILVLLVLRKKHAEQCREPLVCNCTSLLNRSYNFIIYSLHIRQ